MICFCNNQMNEIALKKKQYFLCPNCGFLHKKNIPNDEESRKRYDKHICDDAYKDYMYKIYNKIKPYLKDGTSVDYGCGQIHYLADILNENGLKCDFYDLYYYDVKLKEKYDNIILIEVFEHIENPVEFLSFLKKKLADNSRIIIMTQLVPESYENWWYLNDLTHVSFYTVESLNYLAKLLDFSLEIDIENQVFIFSKK